MQIIEIRMHIHGKQTTGNPQKIHHVSEHLFSLYFKKYCYKLYC